MRNDLNEVWASAKPILKRITETEMICECLTWARDGMPPFTEHHPRCPQCDPLKEATAHITELLKGIDCWASDEDGVHPECWTAYERAKFFLGMRL